MFCLLTWPIHLALGIFFLPFLLLRILIKTLLALIMIPIALLVAAFSIGAVLLAVGLLVAIPLLPFAFAALFIWAIVRLATPRSRAAI